MVFTCGGATIASGTLSDLAVPRIDATIEVSRGGATSLYRVHRVQHRVTTADGVEARSTVFVTLRRVMRVTHADMLRAWEEGRAARGTSQPNPYKVGLRWSAWNAGHEGAPAPHAPEGTR